jgi:hypothetical protein
LFAIAQMAGACFVLVAGGLGERLGYNVTTRIKEEKRSLKQ